MIDEHRKFSFTAASRVRRARWMSLPEAPGGGTGAPKRAAVPLAVLLSRLVPVALAAYA